MATDHLTTIFDQWNVALANHKAGQAAALALQQHPMGYVRYEVLGLAGDASRDLFRAPSPTLGAIRTKLEALWGDRLHEETDFGRARRIAIGDLARIDLLLAGVDSNEASGGMDLERLRSDWADAVQSTHANSPDREELVPAFLGLSAPSLTAVEAKLQAIWDQDDQVDDIDRSVAHIMILRDLRRFILKHEA